MSRIFLIGATGGVGSRLHPMLTGAGHSVAALHRKPEQAETLRAAGLEPVLGDIMEMREADLEQAAKGADVVVFSAGAAGSGRERTDGIDGASAIAAARAAQAAGARFYLVSVIPEAGRNAAPREGFEHYMEVKKRADAQIAAMDLDWVIVRPGTLEDRDATGRVTAGRAVTYDKVARGNVAALLDALIAAPEIRREIVELVDGDTDLADAVAALRRETAA